MVTRFIPAGQQTLSVPISSGQLDADLYWPEKAWGLVLFAHGSGSNRHSPRNRKAATLFFQAGLASCLLDLLFIDEQASDSGMLIGLNQFAQRFAEATQWIESVLGAELPLGFYGASTGAAVALMASLTGPNPVRAIVCRGGRPDLVGQSLRLVQTPTLFLVGSRDPQVLLWNQEALKVLPARTPKQLDVIAGAGHLFEGLGELEAVTERSLNWYRRYLKNEPD